MSKQKERPQCPNCGSYKVWKRGTVWTWGGVVFSILSLPWVLILIGIPFLIAGLGLTAAGLSEISNGNPLRCRACDWVEGKQVTAHE